MNIPHHVTWVDHTTKQKYKTTKFNTFPQISFKILNYQNKPKNIFIGGLDNLYLQAVCTLSENLACKESFKCTERAI